MKSILLLCLIVALTGQVYWNFFIEGFRVSAAVILLPVLLLTLAKDEDPAEVGGWLALFILLFRLLAQVTGGASWADALIAVLPGAMYYAAYGLLFKLLVPEIEEKASIWLIPALAFCDFAANCLEAAMKAGALLSGGNARFWGGLAAVAITRSVLAFLVLAGEGRYRALLTGAQHEARYQRLFMMKTGLKSEVYFMRKNSEEIESVMSSAYRLYEQLSDAGAAKQTQKLALGIARDVHEIKKDYFRIIQGLEQEIGETRDEDGMSLSDLLQVLQDSMERALHKKKQHITLDFSYEQDFVTRHHYALMNVLKNLVANAAEAVEASGRAGHIRLQVRQDQENCRFVVEDNGCGIAPKDIDYIFRMGFSTKFDEKTGSIYRGVGLAGVKMTVEEQLSGSITVKSVPGRGTRFEVLIPRDKLEEKV